MATATELIVAEQLAALAANAAEMGWLLAILGDGTFVLGVPAKDGSHLYWRCETDRYPTWPPAWHWSDAVGKEIDTANVIARGGNFFHDNGVVCAPWNRLAYNAVDKRGPHGDWTIGDWLTNAKTRQCTTLAAMAARLAIEANQRFEKRAADV
jgi:hypothetical protein